MPIYKCECCNYDTNRKSSYDDHLKSRKHNIAFNKLTNFKNDHNESRSDHVNDHSDQNHKNDIVVHCCEICGLGFKQKTNMYRHKRLVCDKKEASNQVTELQNEVKILKDVIVQNELDRLRTECENLKKDKDILIKDKDELLFMNKSSISSLNYVISHYPTAPVLDDIPRLTLEHMMGNYTVPQYIDKILYSYKKNFLAGFIGEYIVDYYKKDDPKDQSIHTSDTLRLCFLLMQFDASDKKPRWVYDKKGDKFNLNIIKPLLASIKEELALYLSNNRERLIEITVEDIGLHVEKLNHAAKILVMIDDKVLETDILKYIAPGLYLKK